MAERQERAARIQAAREEASIRRAARIAERDAKRQKAA